MNIIVAGGSGFIGRSLVRKLLLENNNVTIIGRDICYKSIKIEDYEVKYISTNYSMEELVYILDDCDCIINLASQRYDTLLEDSYNKYQVNVDIAYSIFKAACICGVKNITTISSISVYSTEKDMPWKEDKYTIPKNWYGVSKLIIDSFVDYFNCYFSMSIKSLRLAQVIGYGERRGFMLDTFMRNAYNKQAIILYGRGEGRRQYIYIEDVIDCIYNIMNREDVKGVYNVGLEYNLSHLELANIINESFDNDKKVIIDLSKKEDKSISLMDTYKIRNKIDWEPKWTIEEAFKDIKNKWGAIK